MTKLRTLSVYRSIELGPADEVFVIGCFLVHPAHRRRGVARALADAAGPFVRTWGGRAIEAYPHRTTHPAHDEQAWLGPEALFSNGFRPVHDDGPYPVYRKTLA